MAEREETLSDMDAVLKSNLDEFKALLTDTLRLGEAFNFDGRSLLGYLNYPTATCITVRTFSILY